MTHTAADHLEHAEHSAHASHDDFDKKVTISIAIVAAVLAAVTMLGHRAHNETLRLQGEALTLQTKASIKSTDTANKWAYYQTKNIFNLESEITGELLELIPVREGAESKLKESQKKHKARVDAYSGTGKVEDGEAFVKKHKAGMSEDEQKKQLSKDEQKKLGKLHLSRLEALSLHNESGELMKQSQERIAESHIEHESTTRLDYGELGLQFGVVLCSLAILTKSRSFWYTGLISSAIGAAVAITGPFHLFMGHH